MAIINGMHCCELDITIEFTYIIMKSILCVLSISYCKFWILEVEVTCRCQLGFFFIMNGLPSSNEAEVRIQLAKQDVDVGPINDPTKGLL